MAGRAVAGFGEGESEGFAKKVEMEKIILVFQGKGW